MVAPLREGKLSATKNPQLWEAERGLRGGRVELSSPPKLCHGRWPTPTQKKWARVGKLATTTKGRKTRQTHEDLGRLSLLPPLQQSPTQMRRRKTPRTTHEVQLPMSCRPTPLIPRSTRFAGSEMKLDFQLLQQAFEAEMMMTLIAFTIASPNLSMRVGTDHLKTIIADSISIKQVVHIT